MKEKNHFVFITGLGGDAEHWSPEFIQQVVEKIPNSKAQCLNLKGAGEFLHEIAPYKLEDNIDHLRGQLKSILNQGDKLILIADSLGAMVSLAWCLKFPTEIYAMVLTNMSLGGFNPVYERLRPRAIAHSIKAHFFSKNRDERDRRIQALVINFPDARELFFHRTREIYLKRNMKFSNFVRQLIAGFQYAPKKKYPPKVPVLFLASDGDQLVNSECTKSIHRLWGGELRVHPTAGHTLSTDDSVWTSDQIQDWFHNLESKMENS